MSQSARIFSVIMAMRLLLIGWLHWGTLILTVPSGYFTLPPVIQAASPSAASLSVASWSKLRTKFDAH